jgi:flagellar motor switch protein FliG
MADNETTSGGIVMTESLRAELANINSTQRAAVLMLLLGEDQAADIIRFLNPKEVQALGAAMVQAAAFSQEAVNVVLDDFVDQLKKQNSLSIGNTDYVEKVMKRALGDDKAASVLNRIMPGQGTKGLDILSWMDARGIADMIRGEHPQVIAIILSLLESETAADVLTFMPGDVRPEVIQRIASLDTVQPSAMAELEAIMKQQFSKAASAQSSSFGGVAAAAKIMNNTKTEMEASIMNGLNELDPDLMLKFKTTCSPSKTWCRWTTKAFRCSCVRSNPTCSCWRSKVPARVSKIASLTTCLNVHVACSKTTWKPKAHNAWSMWKMPRRRSCAWRASCQTPAS